MEIGLELVKNKSNSLKLSEVVGLSHSKTLRKIKPIIDNYNKGKGDRTKIGSIDYLDSKGRKQPMYIFDNKQLMYIQSAFDDKLRELIIDMLFGFHDKLVRSIEKEKYYEHKNGMELSFNLDKWKKRALLAEYLLDDHIALKFNRS
ncbi:Rha family transcriptional regulator [Maribacter stanieri]|uniref:Phage regulatory protein Rha (Phage_pRha) n=1 Tax=Maribacter stanieri TaxID=440514 RepID=A0A1I6IEL7_9FLAO|nr:Rha family transcriptional regulator [Maribacter stanieri]SFR65136.1 Phage regulatory protein Rha (Phage_pRha) [Maribacter stanieri]